MTVSQGQQTGVAYRCPVYCGDGHGGIVDEAVADHLSDIVIKPAVGGGHGGQTPGQLIFPGEYYTLCVGFDCDLLQERFCLLDDMEQCLPEYIAGSTISQVRKTGSQVRKTGSQVRRTGSQARRTG